MKYLIIFLILLFNVQIIFGQWFLTFEDSSSLNYISIDSLNYSNNSWQIGKPQKQFFNSAYSLPNAIITDTINTYKPNDTSVFYLYHTVHQIPNWWPTIEFEFKIDADSLTDFGKLEVSRDSGNTWIDVIKAANTYGWELDIISSDYNVWIFDSIAFTGRSNDWYKFHLAMYGWDNYGYNDSILFRFTFISDSIETNSDGWMIDNIIMSEFISNVEEISEDGIYIKIYPTPFNDYAFIKIDDIFSSDRELRIIDVTGRVVKRLPIFYPQQAEIIRAVEIGSGIFFVQLVSEEVVLAREKIVIIQK